MIYSVERLGSFAYSLGRMDFQGLRVNDKGHVVGLRSRPPFIPWVPTGVTRPCIWTPATGAVEVDVAWTSPLSSELWYPTAINASGSVAGWVLFGFMNFRGFRWDPQTPNGFTGVTRPLAGEVLYGGNKVMNSAGVIASYDGQKGVALWRDPSHSPSVLEPGGFVAGINDLDRIAGTHGQAFLWRPDRPQANTGTTYDLGTLPGDQRSEATGINSRGQIVGISRRFWGEGAMVRERAFRWKPAVANGTSGTMKDLGVPAGGVHSRALAINETGIVVGSYTTAAGALRAFRYMSAMNDLNFHILGASGWELQEALDINSSGQILCSGTHLGWLATCLLTPTAWRLSDVDFLRAVTLILGGVRDDSGGWVIPPGRGPVPVPPWVAQFWQRASASKRRSLQKLAVRAPEELIDDEESRRLLHRLVPQLASLRARIGE